MSSCDMVSATLTKLQSGCQTVQAHTFPPLNPHSDKQETKAPTNDNVNYNVNIFDSLVERVHLQ